MRDRSKTEESSSVTPPAAPSRRTARANVRLVYGLACDVEHEDRMQRVDLPAAEGGGATGPHPGQLMRASLGACLAMGYRVWGARRGVVIDSVEIEITCDYDVRGQLGFDDAAPVGWQRVSLDIVIVSSAPEPAVRGVVEQTHRTSPMLANLSASVERLFSLRIVTPD